MRARDRSRCRLAHSFSTAAWSSAITGRGVLDRSAATATDRASLGSFLFVSPASSSRTRAASLGGTSTTYSPAATSCWASRCPSPAAPSTAQARPGHDCAHATSCSACDGQARTRILPKGHSPALIATAVCEPLCGSTPIITAIIGVLHIVIEGRVFPRRACLITVPALAPLLSHTAARPDRPAPRYQARPRTAGRRFGSPAHRASQRYGPGSLPSRPDPQRLPQVSIRRLGKRWLQR